MRKIATLGVTLLVAITCVGCVSHKAYRPLDTSGAFATQIDMNEDLIALYDATFCWFQAEDCTFLPGADQLTGDQIADWRRFGKEFLGPYLCSPDHRQVIVVLEGRTDAPGETEANFSLGLRRAAHVAEILSSPEVGIPKPKIVVTSTGEQHANPKATMEERNQERVVVLSLAVR